VRLSFDHSGCSESGLRRQRTNIRRQLSANCRTGWFWSFADECEAIFWFATDIRGVHVYPGTPGTPHGSGHRQNRCTIGKTTGRWATSEWMSPSLGWSDAINRLLYLRPQRAMPSKRMAWTPATVMNRKNPDPGSRRHANPLIDRVLDPGLWIRSRRGLALKQLAERTRPFRRLKQLVRRTRLDARSDLAEHGEG